jgi:hypothetical protein
MSSALFHLVFNTSAYWRKFFGVDIHSALAIIKLDGGEVSDPKSDIKYRKG